jgi:hypothetical protein
MHDGDVGRRCEWFETLRPLCYLIWHDQQLRDKFRESEFSTGFDWSPSPVRPFVNWLREREQRKEGFLSNYLCMLEFIVTVRGMPVANPNFHPYY